MSSRRYLKKPNPEGYLNTKEVANMTGFSTGTVYNWFKAELLPFTRGVKREYLCRRKDLDKFLRKYYETNLEKLAKDIEDKD